MKLALQRGELDLSETIDDQLHRSALHRAAASGDAGLCRLLVGWGADLALRDALGHTPLCAAVRWDCGLEVCGLLVANGADVDAVDGDGRTLLYRAALQGGAEVCERLLDLGADVDGGVAGSRPLEVAVLCDRLEVCRVLLARGADAELLNSSGLSMVNMSISCRHRAILELLLDHGADINRPSVCPPLTLALSEGDEEVCDLLFAHGARPSSEKLLPRLAARGDVTACRWLLSKGANIHARNYNGESPLFAAADQGRAEVCELLHALGAEVDIGDDGGRTPLYAASRSGHAGLCEMLLRWGAEVDRANKNLRTPLFIASQNGHRACSELLLRGGADPLRSDKNGRTPISAASREESNGDICEALCAAILARTPLDSRGRRELRLPRNRLRCAFAVAAARILKTDLITDRIDLSSNKIQCQGAEAIAEAIKANPRLTAINLSSNDIDERGAQVLAEAIVAGGVAVFRTLDLTSNYLGVFGAQAISRALQSTVSVITATGNTIDRQALAANRALAKQRADEVLPRIRSLAKTLSDDCALADYFSLEVLQQSLARTMISLMMRK